MKHLNPGLKFVFRLAIPLIAAVLGSSVSFAGQVSENFTSSIHMDSANTNAVWNLYSHTLHPPLTVCTAAVPSNNTEDFDVDIGNGSDGAFDVGTYGNFGTIQYGVSTNGGTYNVITLDTDAHPAFNFTYFNLAAGWKIQGTGSNKLWLKVQGTFNNDGIIDCSGPNGSPASNADLTQPNPGAVGVCGGGSGGDGGYQAFGGTGGYSGGSNGGAVANTAGGGGTNSNTVAIPTGGGGGGSYGAATSTTNGTGATGGGGGGTCTSDPDFADFDTAVGGPGSGSGGGGGGAYLKVDGKQSNGGSGGAGGGIIHITCGGDFTQSASGKILANGGNGGDGVASLGGGGGGGGGGGSIIIHSGGNITDHGAVQALNGTGGVAGDGGAGGVGGDGGVGREWITNLGGAAFVDGAGENPPFGGIVIGEVHYKAGSAYTAQTLSYDARNTSPTYTGISLTDSLPNTSTAVVTVAGSVDNFVNDDTGFQPLTNIGALTGKRYFKFKLALQLNPTAGTAATTPATVSTVAVNYDGVQQTDFQFQPACGRFGGPGEFLFDAFLCLILGYFTIGGRGRLIRWRRPSNLPTA